MKTVNIYRFDELTEKAQRAAYESTCMDFSDVYSTDYQKTLEEFERVFDVKVHNWEVGGYCMPSFRYVTAGAADEAPEGDPLRLARYVWNNYAEYIMKGKFFSAPGKYVDGRYTYKHRHSRIMLEMDNCPLTGYCADCDILQPVIDCLHYKRMFSSYDELMEECLTAFFQAWNADVEYCNSFEYFAEECNANDWYFTENGEMWKGAA